MWISVYVKIDIRIYTPKYPIYIYIYPQIHRSDGEDGRTGLSS